MQKSGENNFDKPSENSETKNKYTIAQKNINLFKTFHIKVFMIVFLF